MELSGKVALVTGSKRIGAAVALEIAKGGADVAIVYHTSRLEADATAAAVTALGRRCLSLQADLRDAAACEAVVNDTAATLGRLDVLVNLASVYIPKPFNALTPDDWDATMAVDLRASYLCARAAIPHMGGDGGRIVNCSDWIARSGRPRYRAFFPYYVAKGAVIALTEALALEVAADRILVNAIAPGPIVPPPDTSDEEAGAVEQATPLGRWGGEEEIAKAVLALLDSDFITGETIRVDGGRHLK